jgi:uncharacterized membrane protein YkoI
MVMQTRWLLVAALILGVVLLAGGSLGASAKNDRVTIDARPSTVVDAARDGAENVVRLIGLSDDDDATVAPGTIDDGKALLPRAGITLDEAIAAAQTAAPGAVGEVDLEDENGRLVFNVDVGDKDVTVDAATGEVLGAVSDD